MSGTAFRSVIIAVALLAGALSGSAARALDAIPL